MNGVLEYESAGTTSANKMNFLKNHALVPRSIARPVDQKSSMLPLYQGRPLMGTIVLCTQYLYNNYLLYTLLEYTGE